jgi:hypothetical protein
MAFNLTYDTLKTTVVSYLQNVSESVQSELDTFIMLAQRRLAKDSKTLGTEEYINAPIRAGQTQIAKPKDWRDTLSMSIILPDTKAKKSLILRSYEYCTLYNANVSTGIPIYYADYGFKRWVFAPYPDKEYVLEYCVYKLPNLLDKDTPDNWFTDNAPECLIYATLYETACYLKDDARMATWFQMYSQAVDSLNNEDARRREDRLISLTDEVKAPPLSS